MKQIELFEDLVPIQQYLHIWTEAERAARVKKSCATALETQDNPENRGEESDAAKPIQAASTNSGQISAQSLGRKSLRVTAP